VNSIVCQGSILSGGEVERSVIGNNVKVNSYSFVEGSILFDGVSIGRHAKIRNAIVDKRVQIPPGSVIGYDADEDRKRGFTVTENGVVVIASADGIEKAQRVATSTV
jgi:glucose-1-phosphate adenylyltransferase